MKATICLLSVLLLTVAQCASIRSQQSQINDPAKPRSLVKDCANKAMDANWNFCCDLQVNDTIKKVSRVCVSLKQKNNLEPMATMRGYPNWACKIDLRSRVFCKTNNNDLVRWESESFIRVLNPRDKERSLEACSLGFKKCW